MEEDNKPTPYLQFGRIMIRKIKAIYPNLEKDMYLQMVLKLWIVCEKNLENCNRITDPLITKLHEYLVKEINKEEEIKKEQIKKEELKAEEIKKEQIKKVSILDYNSKEFTLFYSNANPNLIKRFPTMKKEHIDKMVKYLFKIVKETSNDLSLEERINLSLKKLAEEIPKELFYLNDAVKIMTLVA